VQEWDQVRLEYETSPARSRLRELADKHGTSRSTLFKRAAREKWKQNAAIVEAARQQIMKKMEARLEAETAEVAQLAAKEVIAELRPWIEQEKAEHIGRPVNIAKRGLQRIERLWDENAVPEARTESLAAATLDKHDQIIRRNLGLNDAAPSAGALSLNILTNHSLVQVAASAPAAPSPDE
jgi:uncharacterized protein YPO0396